MLKRLDHHDIGRTMIRFGTALSLSAAVVTYASAQTQVAVPLEPLTEVAPTSRALVAVASLLSKGGFDEATMRGGAIAATRTTFHAAGANFNLTASPDATTPRRAFSSPGSPGAAFLVRLPEVTAGVTPDDPARAPHYALASVVGTRLSVWAFFSDVPGDGELSRRMIVALGKLQRPLMMFDTAFQPGLGVGAERYTLK